MTAGWSQDHGSLDQDAVPTLVEVRLAKALKRR